MTPPEIPLLFSCSGRDLTSCAGERLVGIASPSATPTDVGVLIIVGGPQYRVGSHRQFTLLARALAAGGIPAFRFDHRGMGDSDGDMRSFDTIDDDIVRAIDAFMKAVPSLRGVVIWGLCDAASAAMMYAHRDPRVRGLVLLNPWVRDTQTQAVAQIKHYYARRLADGAFWRKLLRGEVRLLNSVTGLMRTSRSAIASTKVPAADSGASFQDRMLAGWRAFAGPSLLVLSGNDLTAREFVEYAQARPPWQKVLATPRVRREEFAEADHTFSTRPWRDRVAALTIDWIRTAVVVAPNPAQPANAR